jgi:hypothetical protein
VEEAEGRAMGSCWMGMGLGCNCRGAARGVRRAVPNTFSSLSSAAWMLLASSGSKDASDRC